MSRPATCSAVLGFRPVTGSGGGFWKNSGTISTRPPMATTSRISTIIRKLLVSTFSCEKVGTGVALSLMVLLLEESGGRHGGGDVDAHGAAAGHRHPGVPGHHQHAAQVQEAADDADHVEG